MQHIPAADVGHVGLSSDQNFCAAEVAQFQYVRLIRGGGDVKKQNKTRQKQKQKGSRLPKKQSRCVGVRKATTRIGNWHVQITDCANSPLYEAVLSTAVSRYKAVEIVWRDWRIALITRSE